MHSLFFFVMLASLAAQLPNDNSMFFSTTEAKKNADCLEFSIAFTASYKHIVAAGFKWISKDKFAAFMMVDGHEYLSEDLFETTRFTALVYLKDAKSLDVVYEKKQSENRYHYWVLDYELQNEDGRTILRQIRRTRYERIKPLPGNYAIKARSNVYYDAECKSIMKDKGEECPCKADDMVYHFRYHLHFALNVLL